MPQAKALVTVYMILALPADTCAVTSPVPLPTVRIARLLLVQMPLPITSDNTIPAPPFATDDAPDIWLTDGVGFTDTAAVAVQLFEMV